MNEPSEARSSSPELSTTLGTCLVTGGGGYFGRLLANRLLAGGCTVRVLDIRRAPGLDERAEFVQADIRDRAAVRRACEDVHTVFHTAAIIDGVTLATRAGRARSHGINVGGTQNVLDACRAQGARRLVYTSSVNVVFDRAIENGDEQERYATGTLDLYSETKRIAEEAVLAANDAELCVCALRPGGIYGPEERHHLPRMVRELLSGKFVMTVGDGSAKADNVFIDNLIDAHVEAAEHLAPGSANAGRAYFISDGEPVNYFEFFRPLIEHLGYRFPKMKMPANLMVGMAWAAEALHRAGGPVPFVTVMETRKLAVSHYFSIEAAHRDFGWRPRVSMAEGLERCTGYVDELLAELSR